MTIHSRVARLLTFSMILAFLIATVVVHLTEFRQAVPLPNAAIQHDAGCVYTAKVRWHPSGWPMIKFVSANGSKAYPELRLLENGKLIGKADRLDDTRVRGMKNRESTLYFSLPGCINPAINGKPYEVSVPVSSAWGGKALWIAAVSALVLLFHRAWSGNPVYRLWIFNLKKVLNAQLSPVDFSRHAILNVGLFTSLLACAVIFLLWVWNAEQSISVSIGAYQFSDASAYWVCANNLLDANHLGLHNITGQWCQRRSTYPALLSGIAWIAQRDIFLTLLAQAALVATSIFLVVRRSANLAGLLGALVCAAMLFRYATTDLFALTMSENAGFIFGCTGSAMLLVACERRSLRWMSAGVAMISIALNARAGAFFVLPFLVLWAGLSASYFKQRIWSWVVAACVAGLTGFVLQSLLVLAIGGNLGNSLSNFSYVLYGLADGGKGWSQVLIEHPELGGVGVQKSNAIYALAWQKIMMHPGLFGRGLKEGFSAFITQGSYGFWRLGYAGQLARVCWWLAWVPLFFNRKHPACLLLALSSFGIVLSAPFLIIDGGYRIFAATVVIDVLQISIGFVWIMWICLQGIKQWRLLDFAENSMSSIQKIAPEMFFTLLLVLLLLIPHTPLRQLRSAAPAAVAQCNQEERTVITRIGKGGTMLLDLVTDNKPVNVFAGQLERQEFLDNMPDSAWWYSQASAFNGASLLIAYPQAKADSNPPSPYLVYSGLHLSEYYGHTVRLCVDRTETQTVFDEPYMKLNSIKALD